MAKQITLFFQSASISFIGDYNDILAKRYDFSQFGPVISGEGDGWQVVAYGFNAPIKHKFYNEKKDTKNPPSIGISG